MKLQFPDCTCLHSNRPSRPAEGGTHRWNSISHGSHASGLMVEMELWLTVLQQERHVSKGGATSVPTPSRHCSWRCVSWRHISTNGVPHYL